MKQDIQNREDIRRLLDTFYTRLLADELIGHFFTRVVKLDWEVHMPVMYDFWETVLFGEMKYKGNPMLKHIELNGMEALKPEHFERWLAHWQATVSENFSGPKADEAVQRAGQVATLMQFKIGQQRK
ncbi:group III truncated hemoglobin [Pontibacter sp. E15-1]|uniref:group III truncated hemoglobin n=1 Tax=Pontibacter sp. E15-1 TaxID=2919918 RepID=UPI001F503978|nr:group III truncated hemoglobin [Pontibacter sp. E15-1]MCJ8165216.1 group III truncated hemoglobin [Pontibacter sp. E15-1]